MESDATSVYSPENAMAAQPVLAPKRGEVIAKAKEQENKAEVAARKARVKKADEAYAREDQGEPFSWRQFADQTAAAGDRFRLFPEYPGSAEDVLNPFVALGNMASGLGAAPLAMQEGRYADAAMGIADPLIEAVPWGKVAKKVGSVVGPVAADVFDATMNRIPGIRDLHRYNPMAFKPNPDMYYRGIGEGGLQDALASRHLRAGSDFRADQQYPARLIQSDKPQISGLQPAPYIASNMQGPDFDRTFFSPYLPIAQSYDENVVAEIPKSSVLFHETPYGPDTDWSKWTNELIPLNEIRMLTPNWLRGYKEIGVTKAIRERELGKKFPATDPGKPMSERVKKSRQNPENLERANVPYTNYDKRKKFEELREKQRNDTKKRVKTTYLAAKEAKEAANQADASRKLKRAMKEILTREKDFINPDKYSYTSPWLQKTKAKKQWRGVVPESPMEQEVFDAVNQKGGLEGLRSIGRDIAQYAPRYVSSAAKGKLARARREIMQLPEDIAEYRLKNPYFGLYNKRLSEHDLWKLRVASSEAHDAARSYNKKR